jgi:hypothetical protein
VKWGNCWFYALPRWLKNPSKTYLIIRLSHESWFPILHVFFARSIAHTEVEEFKPSHWTKKHFIRGPLGLAFKIVPIYAILFHGRIRHGLGEENKSKHTQE